MTALGAIKRGSILSDARHGTQCKQTMGRKIREKNEKLHW